MRLRILSMVLLALMAVPRVAARFGMPEPSTDRGRIITELYDTLFILGTIVFLIVMGLMLYVMIRFRAKGGAGRETFEVERDNIKLEMLWIIIPLIIVLWIGVLGYAGLVQLDEGFAEEDIAMEVQITGYQWTWQAAYGSGVSVFSDPSAQDGSVSDDNVFKVPADVPVRYNITSVDVIHAWFMMDENQSPVMLIDANPYGPHKYTYVTAVLPEGEYDVQCREMCFNPGHAYMRARVEAVPMHEYGAWMEEHAIGAEAGLVQTAAVSYDNGFTGDALVLATGSGSRAVITFSNEGDEPVTVSAPDFQLETAHFRQENMDVELREQDSITVPAGQQQRFAFDVGQTPGDFQLHAGNHTLDMELIEAVPFSVELGDFYIEPEHMELTAGTTYLMQIDNVGGTTHNIFIGDKPNAQQQTVAWRSATIGGGQSTSLLVTVEETMDFDTWCDVAGHYEQGMFGTASVSSG